MMKGIVNIIKTRFENVYVIEDSGVDYIYDETKNDLHEMSNLEESFYKPRKYDSWNMEYDNWKCSKW